MVEILSIIQHLGILLNINISKKSSSTYDWKKQVNIIYHKWQATSFPGVTSHKEPVCQSRSYKRSWLLIWSLGWEYPLGRAWQPSPVFSPGESPGQRYLAGCSSQVPKESDRTEWLTFTCALCIMVWTDSLILKILV